MPTLPEVTITHLNPHTHKNPNFVRGINWGRDYLMRTGLYTDDQLTNLSKFSYNISGKESNYGNGISYRLRNLIGQDLTQAGKKAFVALGLRKQMSEPSLGLTQIKERNITPEMRKALTFEGKVDLTNHYTSGAATIMHAANLDKLNQNIHWKSGKLMSDTDRRAIAWNRTDATHPLTDYKNDESDWKKGSTYLTRFYDSSEM